MVKQDVSFEKAVQLGRQELLPRLSQYKHQYHVAKDRADHYKRKTQELNERATKAESRLEAAIKRCEEQADEMLSLEKQLEAAWQFRDDSDSDFEEAEADAELGDDEEIEDSSLWDEI